MLFCIGTGEPGAPAPAEGGGSVLRLLSNQNFNPTRLIVVSFGAIILLGTFLLHLPISARDGQFTPWLTCLFTATSAPASPVWSWWTARSTGLPSVRG